MYLALESWELASKGNATQLLRRLVILGLVPECQVFKRWTLLPVFPRVWVLLMLQL